MLAIASLGDEKLATDLARNFEGAAATDALRQLAESSNPDIAEQAGAALDQRILSERLSKSSPLVFVSYPDGAAVATGALISADGHILTAEHIVRGARDVWVSFNDNWGNISEVPTDAQPVEIVAMNQELDVALIKLVEPWDALPEPFAMSQEIPPLGTDLLAAGYRGGLEVKLVTKGQLISLDGPNGTW